MQSDIERDTACVKLAWARHADAAARTVKNRPAEDREEASGAALVVTAATKRCS